MTLMVVVIDVTVLHAGGEQFRRPGVSQVQLLLDHRRLSTGRRHSDRIQGAGDRLGRKRLLVAGMAVFGWRSQGRPPRP